MSARVCFSTSRGKWEVRVPAASTRRELFSRAIKALPDPHAVVIRATIISVFSGRTKYSCAEIEEILRRV